MPRRISRGAPRGKDANQDAIVDALEKAGASVLDLSAVGGVLDLLVGFRDVNYLIEVKNPDVHGQLSKSQRKFWDWWRGQKAVVRTAEEALQVIGAIPGPAGR